MHVHVLLHICESVLVWLHLLYVCVDESMVPEALENIFQSLLCWFLIVLWSCLLLCTINSIIYTQSASQPVLVPLCFCQGWVLCALHVMPAPLTVGSGLARPRWDVLAFGQCPLQEARGRQEGYLGEEVASKIEERQRTGPLAQSEPRFRGEKGWGDGFGVPQGAAFMCPEHQAPSGRSAERAVSVTRLPSQDRYALQLLVHSVHLSITFVLMFCKMLRTPHNCCGV